MTGSAEAGDLNEALDVECNSSSEVTLYEISVVDNFTDLGFFLVGKILDAGVRIYAGLSQDIICRLSADAVNIGKTDLYALFLGQVYASNSCHTFSSS